MEYEVRLIDANAMRQDWLENGQNEYVYDTNAVLESIDEQSTIDPESLRQKGLWTENKRTMYSAAVEGDVLWFTYTCSECSWEAMNNSRYCPNCGAKMED